MPLNQDDHLALAAGAALLAGQIIIVREIGSTFFATELTAVAATLTTVAGLSVGYSLAARVDLRFLRFWGLGSLIFLALTPLSIRLLVGLLSGFQIELAAALILGLTIPGFVSGWLATILPRLSKDATHLPRFYALESLGAIAMLLVFAFSPGWRWALALFWTLLAYLVHRTFKRRTATVAAAIAAILLTTAYPLLDYNASRLFYSGYHNLRGIRPVATAYSPFQRIDIIDSEEGRSLFLDGVPFFRSGDLTAFNSALSEVPGMLLAAERRQNALVVGSGSFSSSAKLKKLGYKVTVIELDAEVARLGFEYFQEEHGLKPGVVNVLYGDARRVLRQLPKNHFDVIALDIPAPFHLRTAMLYTPGFYRLVASRLKPNGIASLSLCSYSWTGPVGGAIAASAAKVFGEIFITTSDSVGLSFLYASAQSLPFQPEAVTDAYKTLHLGRVEIGSGPFVRERLETLGIKPLSKRRLLPALTLARWQLPRLHE